ncbi:MAG: SGNH/GDSL hydrolase family protein [Acidobacteria bacterium]|nr:SGNH/GDSL hydrolase family protein [Acidobacteriota bacterium]
MSRRAVLFCLGLAAAACSSVLPTQPGETPTAPGTSAVSYTAVGASDAIGYGSSVTCVPFTDCPNGKGYVQLIAGRLRADGKTVKVLNLGVPGSTVSREFQTLGQQFGIDVLTNFLDNEIPFVATDSTVVTVFAGGNDVNAVARAARSGIGGSDVSGYIRTMRQSFARDLKALVGGIRDRAPSARIVMFNLPNLAALPYSAGLSLTDKRVVQEIAVGFSAEVNAFGAQGALVVDLMCDASFYQSSRYSADGFHPNDTGYARMAEVAYPAVSAGQASAPKASCSQMTTF